jgi:hypothetical protein
MRGTNKLGPNRRVDLPSLQENFKNKTERQANYFVPVRLCATFSIHARDQMVIHYKWLRFPILINNPRY